MNSVCIVFPHQLFQDNPLLKDGSVVYLVEEFLFFKQYAFHKQKIIFHRASMKAYELWLIKLGYKVNYISSYQEESDCRKLIPLLKSKGIQSISILDPVDDWLQQRVITSCDEQHILLKQYDSPMFLNTMSELAYFFHSDKKKFFQTEFYKKERLRHKILVDEAGQPAGGQWTYDIENRKKFPKGKTVVAVEFPASEDGLEEAIQYTQHYFSSNPGDLHAPIRYPIDHASSEAWLQQFLHQRLEEFGMYEDAIVRHEYILFHSVLTPMLNVGLLTPRRVIQETLHVASMQHIPLNSLEGFIRQIIGWREFMRGVYSLKGREQRTRNFWNFSRKIPASFYTGLTGILPVDETIHKVLHTGYCHHIERLMILGNFMLLCEFDPKEVYRWFMELFIDAYDWVMVPNVYGMSQFADGGVLSTKPYISGSNYIMKMSNYPKGEWQEVWDALFWRFLDKQREFFKQNPRLSMLLKTFDQWEVEKKQTYLQRAEYYLMKLNS